MSQKIQFRRGLLSESTAIVLDQGEPAWAVDTKQFFIGDGVTAGGILISGGSAQVSSSVGVTGISITGGNSITGRVIFTGMGSISVFQENQTIKISGASTSISSSNGGVTGISITGGISISGAVSITGLGGIEVFQNGQIIQISGHSIIDGGTF